MTILEALRVTTQSIRDWVAGKFVATNQGTAHTNKVLTVDGNGNVTPMSNTVYVGATKPTDPNVKVWINTSETSTADGAIAVLPRIATITLAAAAWEGTTNPWSQAVSVAGVTESTKADLQPSAQLIVELQDAEISLMIENNNGALVCYAIGNKPTTDYTMQVLLQEVALV